MLNRLWTFALSTHVFCSGLSLGLVSSIGLKWRMLGWWKELTASFIVLRISVLRCAVLSCLGCYFPYWNCVLSSLSRCSLKVFDRVVVSRLAPLCRLFGCSRGLGYANFVATLY